MASIVRHRRRNNFTVLPNTAIRDGRLSFRATGLLCYLLALPDGSPADSEILAAHKREGRDAVRSALRELVTAGYIVRRKEQTELGHWVTITEVTDEPPTTGFQPSGTRKPTLGEPTSDDRSLKAKELSTKGNDGAAPPNGAAAVPEPAADPLAAITAARHALRTARGK